MKKITACCLMLLLAGCSKHHSDDGSSQPAVPGKVTLEQPVQNAICTSGTIISDTRSSITFSWDAAANASNYQLVITNLLTHTDTLVNAPQTQATVPLTRSTPYSWHVISQSASSSSTAQSDTWKFYNAGPGTAASAPFPAELAAPAYGQQLPAGTTTVSLTWQNSSSSTSLTYDIYFGTSSSPPVYKSGINTLSLSNVPVQSAKTYYWQVVTKDSNGNSSYSGISQFNLP
ncbi:hypothetical protein ACFGVR_15070 [Mucilaginibacter sp. AW1-3]